MLNVGVDIYIYVCAILFLDKQNNFKEYTYKLPEFMSRESGGISNVLKRGHRLYTFIQHF